MNVAIAPSPLPAVPRRALTAVRALATVLRDPGRLDQVLVFTQAVNARAIERGVARLAATEEGRRLLEDAPRIDRAHVDYDRLRTLPDGTLGRAYTRFLDANGIGPEPFEALPDIGSPRAAWLMLRMRQSHDLWHVLTGYAPDVRGELLLQAFTYAQTEAPSARAIAFFGTLRYGLRLEHLRDLRDAYRRGRAAAFLPTVRWEDEWETPVRELQTRFGIVPREATFS
jgi:ubiquinone biosynthesis protein COQ4